MRDRAQEQAELDEHLAWLAQVQAAGPPITFETQEIIMPAGGRTRLTDEERRAVSISWCPHCGREPGQCCLAYARNGSGARELARPHKARLRPGRYVRRRMR